MEQRMRKIGPTIHELELYDVVQVTEVTIRNRYQKQIEAMGIHG